MDNGFTPGTELVVDAYFVASDEDSLGKVAERLVECDWKAGQTHSRRRGLWGRKEFWVSTTRVYPRATLRDLDCMVEELGVIAGMHGVEFDGWGAPLPESE